MKYNIFDYNQKKAIELGLDLKDLLILNWIQIFYPKMNKTIRNDKQYFWVKYSAVLSDIPILEIESEKGLYKRMQKMCEIGILEYLPIRTAGGCFAYYLITELMSELVSSHSSQSSTGSSQSSTGSSQSSDAIIYSNTINNHTINSNINTASGFSQSDFLENFIKERLSKMSESEKAGYYAFTVTQLESLAEKLGRPLTQMECQEKCKMVLDKMYPEDKIPECNEVLQPQNPTVRESLTVQKPKKEEEVEAIPNCIDISKWEEWKNYKKEKKQKITKSTAAKQLQNLQKWHLEGQDPNEIIDNSISNGWAGLFPLKQQKPTFNNQYAKPKSDYFAIDKKYLGTTGDDFLNEYINGK